MQYILILNNTGQSFQFKTLNDLYNEVIHAKMLAGQYKIYKVTEVVL